MRSLFKPARNKRLYQNIVDQIQQAIRSGKLKNGEKLPSLKEMKDLFQTSEQTLREALRAVEAKGLIRIAPGKNGGMFVSCDPVKILADNFELLTRLDKITLTDLILLREKLEGDAARIAAQKADKDEIEDIENLVDTAGDFIGQGYGCTEKLIAADKKLHLSLAKIAGNPLVVYSLSAIYNLDRYFPQFHKLETGLMAENYNDMTNIVMAVSNHNPEAAQTISIRHIRKFNHLISG